MRTSCRRQTASLLHGYTRSLSKDYLDFLDTTLLILILILISVSGILIFMFDVNLNIANYININTNIGTMFACIQFL